MSCTRFARSEIKSNINFIGIANSMQTSLFFLLSSFTQIPYQHFVKKQIFLHFNGIISKENRGSFPKTNCLAMFVIWFHITESRMHVSISYTSIYLHKVHKKMRLKVDFDNLLCQKTADKNSVFRPNAIFLLILRGSANKWKKQITPFQAFAVAKKPRNFANFFQ